MTVAMKLNRMDTTLHPYVISKPRALIQNNLHSTRFGDLAAGICTYFSRKSISVCWCAMKCGSQSLLKFIQHFTLCGWGQGSVQACSSKTNLEKKNISLRASLHSTMEEERGFTKPLPQWHVLILPCGCCPETTHLYEVPGTTTASANQCLPCRHREQS